MTDAREEDPTRYSDTVRHEIADLLAATPPGEWAELALCPGDYGCPYRTEAEARAAGVAEDFCPSCRVIHLYRPA